MSGVLGTLGVLGVSGVLGAAGASARGEAGVLGVLGALGALELDYLLERYVAMCRLAGLSSQSTGRTRRRRQNSFFPKAFDHRRGTAGLAGCQAS
jgi:hypothetical protein